MTPTSANPSCTVIICTRNRPELLDRCLAAVARLTYPAYEVLVVDNAPSDDHARTLAARCGARYLRERVIGLSRARNHGARASTSAIVAYLDDDSIPEPSWLDCLAVEFRDPDVMAVTGRIVAIDDPVESEWVRAWRQSLDCGDVRRAVDRREPAWFELANFGGLGDGGNMVFRRLAFEIWPGFHERLGRGVLVAGGEEHHAFFSLIARGYRVVYTPHARVRHPYPTTLDALRKRTLRDRAASAGYMTLLFAEEPAHRRAVVRYVAQWLGGTRRAWRAHPLPSGPRVVPAWRAALAYLGGPARYACSRLIEPAPHAGRRARTPRSRVEVLDSTR
jgi:cellulose synthase/poly-beta-1,6-N-acetylglucosamine synthase-like glycosyltransferase